MNTVLYPFRDYKIIIPAKEEIKADDKSARAAGQQQWLLKTINANRAWLMYHHITLNHIKDLGGAKKIWEAFAGLGMVTQIMRSVLSPEAHVSCDWDEFCVAFMKEHALSPDIRKADAYSVENLDAIREFRPDYLDLDWNTFSPYQVFKGYDKEGARMFQTASDCAPRWLKFGDSSCGKFHLHRARYAQTFGFSEGEDKLGYVRAVSGWMAENYGFIITKAYHDHSNFYYLAEPMNSQGPAHVQQLIDTRLCV